MRQNNLCGFWDESLKDWSTRGCSTKKSTASGIYSCHCDHTTFFALIAVFFKFTFNVYSIKF